VRPGALIALLAGALVAGSAPPARADQVPGQERVDGTAYTLRRRESSIGLARAEFGATDQVMIGTYLAPWLLTLVGVPVPNATVKLRDWFHIPGVALSLRAAFLYLNGRALTQVLTKNDDANAGLVILPLEAAASFRFTERFSQSFQLSYVAMGATGDFPGERSIGGAVATSTGALATLYEFRLTRVVALSLAAKMQIYQGPLRFSGHFEQNGIQVDADVGAAPHMNRLRWNVVPGIAMSWAHVNLNLGLGYGSLWLPFVDLPGSGYGIVPQGDFYVRF
jgi:hypothetical protein